MLLLGANHECVTWMLESDSDSESDMEFGKSLHDVFDECVSDCYIYVIVDLGDDRVKTRKEIFWN